MFRKSIGHSVKRWLECFSCLQTQRLRLAIGRLWIKQKMWSIPARFWDWKEDRLKFKHNQKFNQYQPLHPQCSWAGLVTHRSSHQEISGHSFQMANPFNPKNQKKIKVNTIFIQQRRRTDLKKATTDLIHLIRSPLQANLLTEGRERDRETKRGKKQRKIRKAREIAAGVESEVEAGRKKRAESTDEATYNLSAWHSNLDSLFHVSMVTCYRMNITSLENT